MRTLDKQKFVVGKTYYAVKVYESCYAPYLLCLPEFSSVRCEKIETSFKAKVPRFKSNKLHLQTWESTQSDGSCSRFFVYRSKEKAQKKYVRELNLKEDELAEYQKRIQLVTQSIGFVLGYLNRKLSGK